MRAGSRGGYGPDHSGWAKQGGHLWRDQRGADPAHHLVADHQRGQQSPARNVDLLGQGQ